MSYHTNTRSLTCKAIALAAAFIFLVSGTGFSAALLPESRLDPFFEKNLPAFQDRATLVYAVHKMIGLVKGDGFTLPVIKAAINAIVTLNMIMEENIKTSV